MDDENKQLEKEFDNFFELFRNDGWQQLCKELSTQKEMIDNLSNCVDLDDLRIRQGQLSILNQLINFENFTRESYKDWLAHMNE